MNLKEKFNKHSLRSHAGLWLMHTVVRPEYRGHGGAKALLDATVRYARTNGVLIHAVCSYAVKEFSKSEYDDVNKCKLSFCGFG